MAGMIGTPRCNIGALAQEARSRPRPEPGGGSAKDQGGLSLGGRATVVLPTRPGIPAEPVRLVMPVVYGTHLPGLGEPASRLVKLVSQLSDGALELDLKEPGDGTKPQEILDKV